MKVLKKLMYKIYAYVLGREVDRSRVCIDVQVEAKKLEIMLIVFNN